MARKVSTAGGNLWRLAAQTLGDATQANRLAGANNLLDPYLTGVVTVTLSPVDLAETGGLPFEPITIQQQLPPTTAAVAPPPVIVPAVPPPPAEVDNPPIVAGWTDSQPEFGGILTWWIPADPLPTLTQKLPPSVTATMVNNSPFANRGRGATTNSVILAGWTPPDPLPTLTRKLPPALTAISVSNPPFANPGRGAASQALAFDAWIPPDPPPTLAYKLAPALSASVVSPPVVGGAFAIQPEMGGILNWWNGPPDPLPVMRPRLPASLLASMVSTPPPSGSFSRWQSMVVSAWQPPDPVLQAVAGAYARSLSAAWDVLPNVPAGLTSQSVSSATINLTWTNPGGRAVDTYQVQYSLAGANSWQNGPSVPGLSAQIAGLATSTSYDTRVSANDGVNTSAFSPVYTVSTSAAGAIVTWQPTGKTASITLTNGNLTATAGGSAVVGSTQQGVVSTTSVTTGKVSFEVTMAAGTQNCSVGLCNASFVLASGGGLGVDANGIGLYPFTGAGSQNPQTVWFNSALVLNPASPVADVAGATLSFCVDATNQLLWETTPAARTKYGANEWNALPTASPASGTGGAPIGFAGPYFICFDTEEAGGVAVLNAGSSAFSITMPATFPAWGGAGGTVIIAPGTVTSLTAGTPTTTTVPLNWVNPSTGTAPFTLFIQFSTDNFVTVVNTWGTVTSSVTTATVTGLTPTTPYQFRVYAGNMAGAGMASNVATATTATPLGVPAQVAGVGAGTPVTTSSIPITWPFSLTGSPATSFQVQYKLTTPSALVNFPVSPESPNGTVITGTTGSLVDPLGNVYAIDASARLTLNGAADAGTSTVAQLLILYQRIYQVNAAGVWRLFNAIGNYTQQTADPRTLGLNPTMQQIVTGLLPTTAYNFDVIAINSIGSAAASSFFTASTATLAIGISTVPPEVTQTTFGMSGTLTGYAAPPTLQYQDNGTGGTWLALPAGATVTATTFSFAHPGMAVNGAATVSIRDANHTSIVTTSNLFAVNAAPVGVLTDGISLTQAQVDAVAAAINAQQVSEVPAGECFSGTCYPQNFLIGDTIIATAAGVQKSGVVGSLTDKDGTVWSLVAGVSFQTNPPAWWWGGIKRNGAIIPRADNGLDGYGGYFIALRKLNDGTVWVEEAKQGGWWSLTAANETAVTASATVAFDSFTRPVPGGVNGGGPSPGPGPNNVLPGIVIAAIPQETLLVTFTVSGSLSGYSTAPTLQYQDNQTGSWLALPAGATVTPTSFSFTHPAVGTANNSMTVGVRDANTTTVAALSNAFSVSAAQPVTITGITLSNTTFNGGAASGTAIGTVAVQTTGLTGITLSNTTFAGSSPSGTVVGTLAVQTAPGGAFTGTLSLGGPNASSFTMAGTTLQTQGTLGAGNYSITIIATMPGATGSPFTSPVFVIVGASVSFPGQPTALAATSEASSSVTLSVAPPVGGGALDNGAYTYLYRLTGAGSFTTGPSVPYITPGSGSLSDTGANVYTISAGGVISVNGTPDTSTSNVTQVLLLPNNTVWQKNTALNWYAQPSPAIPFNWTGGNPTSPLASPGVTISGLSATAPQNYDFEVRVSNSSGSGSPCAPITAATTTAPSGQFSVSGGKIMRNAAIDIRRGVCNYVINPVSANPQTQDFATINSVFPGISVFKACLSQNHTPADVQGIVNDWTGHGCVVILANYLHGAQYTIDPSWVAPDAAMFGALAAAFKNNPLVWFSTMNEARSGGAGANLDDDHVATYNAIRNAGNNNIIMFGMWGGSPLFGDNFSQENPAVYHSMTNIVWEDHPYGAQATAGTHPLSERVAAYNGFTTSADGQIPVFWGEWGDAAQGSGGPHDQPDAQIVKDICNSCAGNGSPGVAGQTAWVYDNFGQTGGDCLQVGNRIFQQADNYGQVVANSIANPSLVQ